MEFLRERLEKTEKALGVELKEGAAENIYVFLEELGKWNRAYNLVGRRATLHDLVEHCIDSLSAMMVTGCISEDSKVIDIGTGAGFPGIPLYLVAGPFEMVLLEAVRKKVAFLRHVKRRMGLEQVRVEGLRAEEAAKREELGAGFDLALLRAVTDWRKALPLGRGLLKPKGKMVMLAGPGAAGEMERAQDYLRKTGFLIGEERSSRRITGRDTAVLSLERIGG